MKRIYIMYITAALLAAAGFLIIYGGKVLLPFYDAWLLRGGDLTQHYIGWEFYRSSQWQFPFGLMDRIAYPNSVSVIFTDSIPVFAFLFKIFSSFLPETFQYFGLWELLCFILQSVFAVKLLYIFTENKAASVIGSLFFAVAPIFISRVFFHTALSSQWLILAALYLAVKYIKPRQTDLVKTVLVWGALGMLCGSIHIYYIPMCGIIMASFLLGKVLTEKKIIPSVLIGGSYAIGAISMVFLFGGLSHDHQMDAGGLGQFSFNMNGFFNSMGWSKILPPLPAYGEGSGDGFAYLGMGIFCLLSVCILLSVYSLINKRKQKIKPMGKPNKEQIIDAVVYAFIIIVCIMISASHKFAIDANHVYTIPYPEKLVSLWGMFRSSGRFIWPVVYLIMLWSITVIVKRAKKNSFIIPILVLGLIIQIYEISPVLSSKASEFKTYYTYESSLKSELWEELAKDKKHIVFVSHITENQDILYNVGQYAYLNDMTINDFYLAHSAVSGDIQESREESMKDIQDDTIYIFKSQDEEICAQYPLQYFQADGMIVGIK